jgi:membrane protein
MLDSDLPSDHEPDLPPAAAPLHIHNPLPRAMRSISLSLHILRRVSYGVYNDGLIHAGNMAYMSLVALFPFFIVATSIASIFGRTEDGIAAVNAFLLAVPPNVADALREPISAVLEARSSSGLLWLVALVGLWTTASLIETIRHILRRAYRTPRPGSFWHYRLRSIGIIMISIIMTMLALSAQIALASMDKLLNHVLPFTDATLTILAATRLLPMTVVAIALYVLFLTLSPKSKRGKAYPKWPGAVATALWWYIALMLLPVVLSHLSTYSLTYGSLAGVMITLIFFFLVGLGVVIGAELNAALAEFLFETTPKTDRKLEDTNE